MCDSIGCDRRRRDRYTENDGGEHAAGCTDNMSSFSPNVYVLTGETGTSPSAGCWSAPSNSGLAESDGCLIVFAIFFGKVLHSAMFGNL